MNVHWENWSRTERSTPQRRITPTSPEQIVDAVGEARAGGGSVRAVGAGHSFSGAAMTDGLLLDLSLMRGLISVDLDTNEVTFWAGTYLWEVPGMLHPYDLALQNMGDIDRQTLAGAVSTGTHGTGSRFGSFSSQVSKIQLVSGTGELREFSHHTHGEQLSGVALSLGALGVLYTITLRCVPAFLLHAKEEARNIEAVRSEFLELAARHDHFEFYWFPHTTTARTKVNTRIQLPAQTQPQNRVRRFVDEEIANNGILGALVSFQYLFPRSTPKLNKMVSGASSSREYVDFWNEVFVTRRRVRFREMEYALPVETIPTVLRELEREIDRRKLTVSFPVEVRTAAAETAWLSPSRGKDIGYVAVHRYWREKDRSYFAMAEELFLAHGGLPHLGKMHSLGAEEFMRKLPHFSAFIGLRNELDPDRVFRNRYLEAVLGH